MVPCTFTSEWDDGSVVVTQCTYDPDTGEVNPDAADIDPDASLEREFITLRPGSRSEEEIKVCPECHAYTMKTILGDRADQSYGEMEICRNHDCDSNQ